MDILNLQKDVLDLSKAFELNLVKAGLPANLKMQTRLGIDRSPSMEEEFECGWVAKTVDIFLAAALKFDDDGSLTVGITEYAQDALGDIVFVELPQVGKAFTAGDDAAHRLAVIGPALPREAPSPRGGL